MATGVTTWNFPMQILSWIGIVLLILCARDLFAQEKSFHVSARGLEASSPITLDGLLDEAVWKTAEQTSRFTGYEPDFGKPARHNTIARFLYDDYGLYIGLEMLDNTPDSIFKDLSIRDDMGNADWVGIILSPANDGQNGFRFQITPAGVQYDAKIIEDENDESWDAVWYGKTGFTVQGWVAEILIPWSAIRFPNLKSQSWNMNIIREVRRYREQSTWHPVDKKRHGFLTQCGKLTGLNNLHPPVRLSLMPYASGYLQKITNEDHPSWTFNAGMDLKYGILNNYTLDVTLIPDFGQVRSDDEIYNFSPYEVQYNENRPFFTEGTELFDKSGIFYSRRIGRIPAGYESVTYSLKEGEMIITNPVETQLINATKFSGRNNKGLAIGIFNAMTAGSYAIISDSSGHSRKLETQSFTNYNMVVLDQSVINNSYVHLANTHLCRNDYIAHVTATSFQLKNRKQRLALTGKGMISQQHIGGIKQTPGFQYLLGVSKINGNLRWKISHSAIDKNYNSNDMGYLAMNNIADLYGEIGYYQFQPIRNMLEYHSVFSLTYQMLGEGFTFTHLKLNFQGMTTYTNRLTLGLNMESIPIEFHDYFEAREPGRVFHQPGYTSVNLWLSPDYRKRFLVDITIAGWSSHDAEQKGWYISAAPRLRLNSRMFLVLKSEYDHEVPSVGYVTNYTKQDTTIILFGMREVRRVINTLSVSYVVSPHSSFSLRVRHYWVTTRYSDYYQLPVTGYVQPIIHDENHNFTVNIFNIDLGYSWNFAPGSFLNIMYKNSLNKMEEGMVISRFIHNIRDMADSPANNSISVKLIYYFDYETVRRNIKKRGS